LANIYLNCKACQIGLNNFQGSTDKVCLIENKNKNQKM
jgi:hypothetical protein